MNDYDIDFYGIVPKFSFGNTGSIQPFFVYAFSDDASLGAKAYKWTYYYEEIGPSGVVDYTDFEEINLVTPGFDLDLNFDPVSLWMTGIYQFGAVDFQDGTDADVGAWLSAAGATANFDAFDIHDQASQNAPGYKKITNTVAYNLGVGFKATTDLSFKLDLWYAHLVEEIEAGLDKELGSEIDLSVTCKLMKGLKLDLVGAYLFAGDSTTRDVANHENPYEIGAQLSLSF